METSEKLSLLRKAKAKGGKSVARERVQALLDEGSFIELGALATAKSGAEAADGVVTGYGTVDERLVFVYSQDPAVLGGAVGETHAKKICAIYEKAAKMGAPVVGILDSCGVRIDEGVRAQSAMASIFAAKAKISGVVPTISVVMGNCAGGAAMEASMSDFVIINEKTGRLFVNGPAVIKASTGKDAKVDAKGAYGVCGSAHLMAANDFECAQAARLLLSYLPSNNLCDSVALECTDDLNRLCPELEDIEGEFDMRIVIAQTVDDGALFELKAEYAKEAVVGFARINGVTVGVCANQPGQNSGCLTGSALEKISGFVRFCDCFNIPVVTFTSADGFAVSASEEEWGLAKKGAKMIYAFAQATVPKVNVIVGKAYGSSYCAMNSKELGADVVYAFPQAQIAPLSSAAGVQLLYEDKLHEGKKRSELEESYKKIDASPIIAAAEGAIDDVIEPAQVRCRVAAALEMLASKRESVIPRKHDNMPL